MASPGRGPIACLEGVGAPALVDVVLEEVRAPAEDVLPLIERAPSLDSGRTPQESPVASPQA